MVVVVYFLFSCFVCVCVVKRKKEKQRRKRRMSYQSVALGPAFPLPSVIDGIFGNSAGSYNRNQVGSTSMIPNPISGRKTIASNPIIADSYESAATKTGIASAGPTDPLFGHIGPESLLSRLEQSQMMGVLNIPRGAAHSLASVSSKDNGSQWNLFSAPVAPGSRATAQFQSLLPRAPGGGVAPRAGGAGVGGAGEGGGRGRGPAVQGARTYNKPPDRNGNEGVTNRAENLKSVRAGDRTPAELMSSQSRRVAAAAAIAAPRKSTHRKYKCHGGCNGKCTSCKKKRRY